MTDLSALLEMQVNAAKAKLYQATQREEKLQHLLRDLDTQSATTNSRITATNILDCRNDINLRRWIDQRRASINTEMAQVRASIAISRVEVQHHFARYQALKKVNHRAIAKKKIIAARKNYWGS